MIRNGVWFTKGLEEVEEERENRGEHQGVFLDDGIAQYCDYHVDFMNL